MSGTSKTKYKSICVDHTGYKYAQIEKKEKPNQCNFLLTHFKKPNSLTGYSILSNLLNSPASAV